MIDCCLAYVLSPCCFKTCRDFGVQKQDTLARFVLDYAKSWFEECGRVELYGRNLTFERKVSDSCSSFNCGKFLQAYWNSSLFNVKTGYKHEALKLYGFENGNVTFLNTI